jgi:hypothetical protein
MKLETTLSRVGRSIDIAITAVQTQTPILVNATRSGLAGILANAADRVRPERIESSSFDTQPQGNEAKEPATSNVPSQACQEPTASTMEEAAL